MPNFDLNYASFTEWRGIVKTAIDFIKDALDRLRNEDLEQWETIEQIRQMLEKHRDRCDTFSSNKANCVDLDQLKIELKTKASAATVQRIEADIKAQDKIQTKQGVTLVFYGLIGGALFSGLMALFSFIIRKLIP